MAAIPPIVSADFDALHRHLQTTPLFSTNAELRVWQYGTFTAKVKQKGGNPLVYVGTIINRYLQNIAHNITDPNARTSYIALLNSHVWMNHFLKEFPMRTGERTQSYTKWFRSVLGFKKGDIRKKLQVGVFAAGADDQCIGIGMPAVPGTLCYICGVRMTSTDVMDCEHILPFCSGIRMLWLAKASNNPAGGIGHLLSAEYRWAHSCCNQRKSDYEYIKPDTVQNMYVLSNPLSPTDSAHHMYKAMVRNRCPDDPGAPGAVPHSQYMAKYITSVKPLLEHILLGINQEITSKFGKSLAMYEAYAMLKIFSCITPQNINGILRGGMHDFIEVNDVTIPNYPKNIDGTINEEAFVTVYGKQNLIPEVIQNTQQTVTNVDQLLRSPTIEALLRYVPTADELDIEFAQIYDRNIEGVQKQDNNYNCLLVNLLCDSIDVYFESKGTNLDALKHILITTFILNCDNITRNTHLADINGWYLLSVPEILLKTSTFSHMYSRYNTMTYYSFAYLNPGCRPYIHIIFREKGINLLRFVRQDGRFYEEDFFKALLRYQVADMTYSKMYLESVKEELKIGQQKKAELKRQQRREELQEMTTKNRFKARGTRNSNGRTAKRMQKANMNRTKKKYSALAARRMGY
jgi:hypothetical protein